MPKINLDEYFSYPDEDNRPRSKHKFKLREERERKRVVKSHRRVDKYAVTEEEEE